MEEDTNRTLDLSRRSLKKVPKEESAQSVRSLILDDNELQKIDNIDSYLRIETLSIARNQLLRMYGVCRLHNLRDLNLSYNGILTIEGLKELQHLVRLNLTGNNIKTIEHLQTNHRLQYLNLNDNSITNVGDLSYLRDLRELHLNGNRISHLRQCDKYLPSQLTALDLGRNNLTDLNEICTLVGLVTLNSIVIADNPCVQMVGPVANGFDYRPFVLNWCMTVQIIDGFAVTPIESLKAEWLYSQGRGRQFRVGEQAPLARYLASSCPLNAEALESDSERKLRLILSKAQQHQKQLQDEILNPDTSLTTSMNSTLNSSPGSGRRRGVSHRIQSPRCESKEIYSSNRFTRLTVYFLVAVQSRIGVTARQGSPPDSMISSYHGTTSGSALDGTPSFQMSTSLIENIKKSSSAADVMSQSLDVNHFRNNGGNPLAAASKMMPVPELMSPDCGGPAMTAAQMLQSSRNAVAVNNRMGNVVKRGEWMDVKDSDENKSYSNLLLDSNKTMSPKLTRPNQMSGVRKTSSSSMVAAAASPPTATSPRRATSATGSTKSTSTTLIQSTQPADHSSDDEDDDGEVFSEDKLRTIRDKAAMK